MQIASAQSSQDPSPVPLQGSLTIAVDRARNVIKVVGRGFWSVDYVAGHIREFEAALIDARHQMLGELMREQGLDGILLSRPSNFAWFTTGGDSTRGSWNDVSSQ